MKVISQSSKLAIGKDVPDSNRRIRSRPRHADLISPERNTLLPSIKPVKCVRFESYPDLDPAKLSLYFITILAAIMAAMFTLLVLLYVPLLAI